MTDQTAELNEMQEVIQEASKRLSNLLALKTALQNKQVKDLTDLIPIFLTMPKDISIVCAVYHHHPDTTELHSCIREIRRTLTDVNTLVENALDDGVTCSDGVRLMWEYFHE